MFRGTREGKQQYLCPGTAGQLWIGKAEDQTSDPPTSRQMEMLCYEGEGFSWHTFASIPTIDPGCNPPLAP